MSTRHTYRVVQWATGSVGACALRAIIEHPDLELVGVLVFDPAKEGRDAGTLCGLGDTGVMATRDADSLVALRPDCVSHCPRNTRQTTEEMATILESGVNVVSVALLRRFTRGLGTYRSAAPNVWRRRVSAAAPACSCPASIPASPPMPSPCC
jgi:hypothetical protein